TYGTCFAPRIGNHSQPSWSESSMPINCETRLQFAKGNLLLGIVPCACAVVFLFPTLLSDVRIIVPGPLMLFGASMLLALSGVLWFLSANDFFVKSLSVIAIIVHLAAVVIGVAGNVLTILGVTIYPEDNVIEIRSFAASQTSESTSCMVLCCLFFWVLPAIAFVFSGIRVWFYWYKAGRDDARNGRRRTVTDER